ncbi:glycosyltransferase family 4 protein [Larsenimonas rhizosphaerae]|uniref:glycosyltransferase family 4 protein n=1 Tax=Larsenimonas rhizosphaerae TaxID=2944682 RepID=UPI00203402F0|nr:glycosyltransferase family 4 protein [Larsenimonas rhizosphaerae]MCM2130914.1 glycosyltransferase family 4 protein [Larsenimonas rhizosphaerae]
MTSLRKVLFIIPRYWPAVGGAELHTRELLRYTRTLSASVACVSQQAGTSLEVALGENTPIIRDPQGPPVIRLHAPPSYQLGLRLLGRRVEHHRWARPLYTRLMKQALRAELMALAAQHDIVHYIYNGLTGLAELAADCARETGTAFFLTPLCGDVGVPSAWTTPRFKRLYRRADGCITLTNFERDWLIEQGAIPEKTHVLPVSTLLSPTHDARAFRQEHDLGDRPILLFLGRHENHKGVHFLHDALETLWKSVPELRVVMMGPEGECRLNADHSDDPRLIRIVAPSQEAKASALAACTLLCVPSLLEGLGVVYLEAWHFSKPVVALDLPVLREVIGHQEGGLLGRIDGSDLAEHILALLDDPALRRRLGQAGHQRLQTRYRWETLAHTLEALYANSPPGKKALAKDIPDGDL